MNLAGNEATVTFDQSGTGLLKLTSAILISGYGHSKTIALRGDTAGTGELAGDLTDPHDRTGKATTTLTKSGTGKWTLSGSNSCRGPTKIAGGVLVCMKADSLSSGPLAISGGARLHLSFNGTRKVAALTLNGDSPATPGTFGSTASTAEHKDDSCFSGSGTITVTPRD